MTFSNRAERELFGPGRRGRPVARWQRWVFELRAPADEFSRHLERALTAKGVRVTPAEAFDFQARALGARAFVKVEWAQTGLAMVVKVKGGFFASPLGLERLVLDAGREAQARLTYGGET